jgi:ABC-type multidrug transport system fused ATPase/permease subunit
LSKLGSFWSTGSIGRSLRVLPPGDQKKIIVVTIIQVFMGFLDLLGVLAIGLLGALSVSGIQSRSPGDRVSGVLNFLRISETSFQLQVTFIGTTATFLLVGRTILSMIITRRILFFLSNRGAMISSNLVARILAQPLLFIQTRTSHETLFALTSGVSVITLQILATCIVMVADISLLLVMAVGLFVVDPGTALGTFAVFGIIGFILYRFMHLRANELGVESSQLNILSNQKITEVFSSYRESVVRNRRDYYSREIGKIRFLLAGNSAEMNFMPYVSKYVIETAMILGAVSLAAVQFVLQDATQAVATLAIFLAAGTRIAPAVLRVQQGMVTISGAIGQSAPTLNLIDQLGSAPVIENIDDSVDVTHEGFVSEVNVKEVSLSYPNGSGYAIEKITLDIPVGSSVALVGPSGAGKTTLVDVILGVLSADEGTVSISGLSPLSAISKWPGAIAYVPQDVMISSGTIRQNVSLGYPIEAAKEDLVRSALKVAQLNEFVSNLPNGIDTHVGEQGSKISGGQRQRLGIARAMFTRPHLLVLDEATSSLDGETEASISEAIHELRGSTTVLLIAHRLSTVRNADIVVYLSNGRIIASGTFEQVRAAVPDFDRQASLMGL